MSEVALLTDYELVPTGRAARRRPRAFFLTDDAIDSDSGSDIRIDVASVFEAMPAKRSALDTSLKGRLLAMLGSAEFAAMQADEVGVRPCETSISRAKDFISLLPREKALPQVAVDEEGDVLLAWSGVKPVIVTVEKALLHAAIDAGTENSRHLDGIGFDGHAIPVEVLQAVPDR